MTPFRIRNRLKSMLGVEEAQRGAGPARHVRGREHEHVHENENEHEHEHVHENEHEHDDGPADLEIDGAVAVAWTSERDDVVVLDIREPWETAGGYPAGATLMPMNSIPSRLGELPRDKRLIVLCAHGVRSYSVTHWLRNQGVERAWSLAGGIGEWYAAGGEIVR